MGTSLLIRKRVLRISWLTSPDRFHFILVTAGSGADILISTWLIVMYFRHPSFFPAHCLCLVDVFPSNGWFGIPHRLLILLSEHLSQPHVHLLIYTPHFGQFHHPLPACQMTFSLALWPTTWYPTLLSSIILVSNPPAPNSPVSSVELRSLLFFFFQSGSAVPCGRAKGCLQNWELTVAVTRR